MNLVLIGFRGTGKTTIGKMLAKKLGLEFIDSDELIEKRYGFTVDEVFQHHKEPLFRLWESDLINEISKLDSRVIAIGGGAIMKYKNVKSLKRHGLIVLLETSPEVIHRRILKDDKTKGKNLKPRHQLTEVELYQNIKDLLDFRHYYYHGACDYVVDTTERPIEVVLDEIMAYLRSAGFIPP